MFDYIGKSLPRNDGFDKATGFGKFTTDIYLPHMLYAKVLRSPYAHAKVVSIDTSEAEALPGVRAICTWDDVPHIPFNGAAAGITANPGTQPVRDQYILTNEPRYIGDEIAAVAADTEEIAKKAVELIKVEYEERPAVYDVLEAMKPDAPLVQPEFG
ncbi:MAG: carbon monoxide dehydrogenase, partial [Oscillospiraceae bacterium]|nr:carbon monoxide dehydrogenase [Oscillospiraceae bacterium]